MRAHSSLPRTCRRRSRHSGEQESFAIPTKAPDLTSSGMQAFETLRSRIAHRWSGRVHGSVRAAAAVKHRASGFCVHRRRTRGSGRAGVSGSRDAGDTRAVAARFKLVIIPEHARRGSRAPYAHAGAESAFPRCGVTQHLPLGLKRLSRLEALPVDSAHRQLRKEQNEMQSHQRRCAAAARH